MTKKTKYIAVLILLAVILLECFLYSAKHPARLICAADPAQVSEIQILDGSTGKSYKVTDKTSIQHIVSNLNSVHFIRGDQVEGNFSYDIILKNTKSESLWEGSIDSPDTIIYNGYFYKGDIASVDYGYIQTLLKKDAE